jgi:hypothetical protein
LEQIEGASQDETASRSLEKVKTEFASLQSGDVRTVSLGDSTQEHTRIEPEAGNLTISTPDGTEYNTTLGAIVYEQGDTHIAYQGGGVWELHGDTATMVSRPSSGVQVDDGVPTVRFAATAVRGRPQSGSDFTARARRSNASFRNLPTRLPEGQTTLEIESKYYEAWGDLFEENAEVEYDHDESTAIVRINVHEESDVGNALAADGSGALGGGIEVSSFDSRSAEDGHVGENGYEETNNGDVFVRESFDGGGSATVNGDVYVDGDFTISGGSHVNGNIYATGDVTINNDISKTVVAGGDVIVSNGGVSFGEDSEVRASGELRDTGGGNTYSGVVHVGDEFSATGGGTKLTGSGEIRSGGTASISRNNGGDVIEGASGPSTSELDRIDEMAANVPEPAAEVQTAVDMYEDDNDNAELGTLGGNNANDVISAGNYYYDGDLSYGGNPSITFDTSGGDINLVVDGDVDAQNVEAEIVGDGRVNIYTTGSFETGGNAEWTNEDGAGDRLWVYTADPTTETSIAQEFYGVILSEAEVQLGGGTTLYGAIVTERGDIHGGQTIYYDEAIRDADIGGSGAGSEYDRSYVDISVTEITVENE